MDLIDDDHKHTGHQLQNRKMQFYPRRDGSYSHSLTAIHNSMFTVLALSWLGDQYRQIADDKIAVSIEAYD